MEDLFENKKNSIDALAKIVANMQQIYAIAQNIEQYCDEYAYRKKQSKKPGNNIQEKQTDKSTKEVMKKEPQEQEIIKPSKKQAESAKRKNGFRDLKSESIDE